MENFSLQHTGAILLRATNMRYDQRTGNLNLLGRIFPPQPMGKAVLFAWPSLVLKLFMVRYYQTCEEPQIKITFLLTNGRGNKLISCYFLRSDNKMHIYPGREIAGFSCPKLWLLKVKAAESRKLMDTWQAQQPSEHGATESRQPPHTAQRLTSLLPSPQGCCDRTQPGVVFALPTLDFKPGSLQEKGLVERHRRWEGHGQPSLRQSIVGNVEERMQEFLSWVLQPRGRTD